MTLVKVGESYISPSAVEMIVPDRGEYFGGAQTRAPDENRCSILMTGGHRIEVPMSVEATRGLFA